MPRVRTELLVAWTVASGAAGAAAALAGGSAAGWAAAGAVAVVGGLGGFVVGRRAAARLDEAARFVTTLAGGLAERRLPEPARDALGALGDALDALAEALGRRVEAEAEERERLETVLAAMQEGVLAVDASERVLLANPRFAEVFGLRGALAGRPLLEAIRDTAAVALLRATMSDGVPRTGELTAGARADRRLRLHVAPLSASQAARGAVAVFHDVTELVRLETVRRDFVANASHELKTPLAAIRGFAERLVDRALRDPEAERAARTILANAERLGALVEDLLALSRIEGGSLTLRAEPVDAAQLVRALVASLEPELRKAELRADVEIEGDPVVRTDRRALEQVLGNLVDNARKYTDPGGEIHVRVRGEREHVRIEVADTGIGIPARDLARVFERFYRVDPGRSRARGGTGLGLSIVRHLTYALGGQVAVESRVGHGSTFRIVLPRLLVVAESEVPPA